MLGRKTIMNELYLNDFLAYLKNQKRYSYHTLESYKNDLSFFFSYIKKENIDNINSFCIQNYLSYLYISNKSMSTISRKLSSIKSYGKYLAKHKSIDCSFLNTISIAKKKNELPEYIHDDELEILLNLPTNNLLDLRNSLIIHLLYSTGLRLSELTNLKTSDYDNQKPVFIVTGKGNKQRIVIFSSRAQILLERYLKERNLIDEPYLLLNKNNTKLTNRGVELILTSISKKYLGHTKLHPHMLRHTFATKLLNKGMDIRTLQELLGHDSLAATQIYTHLAKSELLELYTTYHPRGDNSSI